MTIIQTITAVHEEGSVKGRETDLWSIVHAKWFAPVPETTKRIVTNIVIHDMEYPETVHSAEDVAKYFQNGSDGRKASAHVCVDADSVVQCVRDNDIAYAAPGLNSHGIQIELAGYARQSREEWLDEYGIRLLENAADVVAQYCVKYDIPPLKLTDEQLEADGHGIVGHDQVSRIFKRSDHTDPGPNFPWDYLMEHVGLFYQKYLAE